jgi:hypothetical protein
MVFWIRVRQSPSHMARLICICAARDQVKPFAHGFIALIEQVLRLISSCVRED